MVVGQIARDIVLQVDSIPAAGSAAPATQRLEMLGGKGLIVSAVGPDGWRYVESLPRRC